jgi:hypothetical protein
MRRAVTILALAALFCAAALVEPARAQTTINAIGLIDFGQPPDFQVGSWVRYLMKSRSATGVLDEYTVTVMIPGEEHWWGEDCFWVETWTEAVGKPTRATASLMSYEVFQDSLGLMRMQYYVRKVINGHDEQGRPVQELNMRPASTLRSREEPTPTFRVQIDTLGRETVALDVGSFDCLRVQFRQGRAQTGSQQDSTDYTELRETRDAFLNPRVPITHLVREDIEQRMTRKAWKIGASQDATPTIVLDDTRGSAVLVEFGYDGRSRMLPESMRKSLADRRARPGRTSAPARRPPAPGPSPRPSG